MHAVHIKNILIELFACFSKLWEFLYLFDLKIFGCLPTREYFYYYCIHFARNNVYHSSIPFFFFNDFIFIIKKIVNLHINLSIYISVHFAEMKVFLIIVHLKTFAMLWNEISLFKYLPKKNIVPFLLGNKHKVICEATNGCPLAWACVCVCMGVEVRAFAREYLFGWCSAQCNGHEVPIKPLWEA